MVQPSSQPGRTGLSPLIVPTHANPLDGFWGVLGGGVGKFPPLPKASHAVADFSLPQLIL